MSREQLEPAKPAIVIWTTPRNALDMKKGYYPNTFYFNNPNPLKDSMDYIQIIIPLDVFEVMWEEKIKLDIEANDLKI
jgi:hypothetical protein